MTFYFEFDDNASNYKLKVTQIIYLLLLIPLPKEFNNYYLKGYTVFYYY